jgi:hypothetical protein
MHSNVTDGGLCVCKDDKLCMCWFVHLVGHLEHTIQNNCSRS